MSWQKGKGGWGGSGNGSGTPPDLEELIHKGQAQLRRIAPGGSPRGPFGFAIIILVLLTAWTAYYTVPSDSVAIIQRFGKYVKEVPPGLHFKFPLVSTWRPLSRSNGN